MMEEHHPKKVWNAISKTLPDTVEKTKHAYCSYKIDVGKDDKIKWSDGIYYDKLFYSWLLSNSMRSYPDSDHIYPWLCLCQAGACDEQTLECTMKLIKDQLHFSPSSDTNNTPRTAIDILYSLRPMSMYNRIKHHSPELDDCVSELLHSVPSLLGMCIAIVRDTLVSPQPTTLKLPSIKSVLRLHLLMLVDELMRNHISSLSEKGHELKTSLDEEQLVRNFCGFHRVPSGILRATLPLFDYCKQQVQSVEKSTALKLYLQHIVNSYQKELFKPGQTGITLHGSHGISHFDFHALFHMDFLESGLRPAGHDISKRLKEQMSDMTKPEIPLTGVVYVDSCHPDSKNKNVCVKLVWKCSNEHNHSVSIEIELISTRYPDIQLWVLKTRIRMRPSNCQLIMQIVIT